MTKHHREPLPGDWLRGIARWGPLLYLFLMASMGLDVYFGIRDHASMAAIPGAVSTFTLMTIMFVVMIWLRPHLRERARKLDETVGR